jgi:ATP-dependent exoDNAse (exonuclease V) beta subunit
MTEPAEHLATILAVIEETRGSSDRFAETLRHRHIPHLSFSQITTVEFCQQRYFLEYVCLLEPTPIPDYFTKGKLLHQVIASFYEKEVGCQEDGAGSAEEAYQVIDRAYEGENRLHLRNAYTVHLQNRWQDCQVLAVEQPFAMLVGPALPPIVGVIDLILRKDGAIVIVDHKTGRDFYPEDELQMAIYVQYIQQHFGDRTCAFYYDHYRWVNNLARIRKPAFQRKQAHFSSAKWPAALERIEKGAKLADQIRATKRAEKNGECFRCPYRKVCW